MDLPQALISDDQDLKEAALYLYGEPTIYEYDEE